MSKFLETVFEIVGWIQIAISPLLIGAGIGAIIYYRNPTKTTLAAGIGVGILGLLIGILWANKVWRSKKGTINFISKISSTPELDNKVDMNDEKNNK